MLLVYRKYSAVRVLRTEVTEAKPGSAVKNDVVYTLNACNEAEGSYAGYLITTGENLQRLIFLRQTPV